VFDKALGTYHSYSEMAAMLQDYADAHPGVCRLVNVGNSHQGRGLWALLITDNPDVEEDEPEFKYVSTIHGDEPLGMEMCLYFIDLLLTSYGAATTEGQRITALLDETAIWVMPLMNPDARGRQPVQRAVVRPQPELPRVPGRLHGHCIRRRTPWRCRPPGRGGARDAVDHREPLRSVGQLS